METEHILIFEPLIGGHRAEFIAHLMDYISKSGDDRRRYTFVLGALPSGFDDLPNVTLRELSDEDKAAVSNASGPLGGFVAWRILKGYLDELQPDRLIIMDLTWLELPLCIHRPSCPFVGILFVQYPELRRLAHKGWVLRTKLWWKELKTWKFLRTSRPEKVFLLNGAHACDYLNKRFNASCYVPIPDPVPKITADPTVRIRQEYSVDNDRRLFLFFGSMSARKGVDQLVKALGSLSDEAAQKCAFVFCGMPEPDYAEHYHELIDHLVRERPDVCLHLEEQFVSSARMRAMFEQADWILMPYTRPEYSSGILAHAAAAATPVIGPADGLVGRQIREHGLGLDVPLDTLSRVIGEAVVEDYVFDELARLAFVETSSPEKFAATLLEV